MSQIYILDTDHVTLLQNSHPVLIQRIRQKHPESIKEMTKLSDRFYGSIQDDTFFRHPQLEQPDRQAF